MTAFEVRHGSRVSCWVMTLVGLCAAPPVLGATYKVGPGSAVSFSAKITAGSFEAKTQAISGSVDYDPASGKLQKGTVVVKASTLETGMGLRDRHMNEKYLEVEKFPEIKLELKEAAALTPAATAKGVELSGVLTVKGASQPVKVLVVAVQGEGGKITVTSTFPLDVTQYGIPQPKYAVVKMESVVVVSVTLALLAP